MSKPPSDGAAFIASQVFTRTRSDGMITEWHQENESAAANRADAVAIVQRTIDFWLPSLVTDLQKHRNIPLADASAMAIEGFKVNMTEMMATPFPQRWGMTLADFNFDLEDKL